MLKLIWLPFSMLIGVVMWPFLFLICVGCGLVDGFTSQKAPRSWGGRGCCPNCGAYGRMRHHPGCPTPEMTCRA